MYMKGARETRIIEMTDNISRTVSLKSKVNIRVGIMILTLRFNISKKDPQSLIDFNLSQGDILISNLKI